MMRSFGKVNLFLPCTPWQVDSIKFCPFSKLGVCDRNANLEHLEYDSQDPDQKISYELITNSKLLNVYEKELLSQSTKVNTDEAVKRAWNSVRQKLIDEALPGIISGLYRGAPNENYEKALQILRKIHNTFKCELDAKKFIYTENQNCELRNNKFKEETETKHLEIQSKLVKCESELKASKDARDIFQSEFKKLDILYKKTCEEKMVAESSVLCLRKCIARLEDETNKLKNTIKKIRQDIDNAQDNNDIVSLTTNSLVRGVDRSLDAFQSCCQNTIEHFGIKEGCSKKTNTNLPSTNPTTDPNMLINQMECNSINQIDSCTICNQHFKSKRTLKVHRNHKHGEGHFPEYKCLRCKKTFTTKSNLKTHTQGIRKCKEQTAELN